MAQEGLKKGREKAGLEMTLEDHVAIGSTPTPDLLANPGKAPAEFMSPNQLKAFIMAQVEGCREQFERALTGDKREIHIFNLVFGHFLGPNIRYLRRIKKLPPELKNLRLKDFALPKS